jgi:arylsulfatase A-like enzyme
MIMADDLGWYDTSIYNPVSPTPKIAELVGEGMRLDRHYVFRYCSPTRRAFLSGRFPNRITSVQPDGSNTCSDFLPLAVDIIPQKLATAGYASHFVGKGHLGYETMDHLPVNRGFKSHVGYLGGAEKYTYGSGSQDPSKGSHDMWHNLAPGVAIVPQIFYSANFYAQSAVNILEAHDTKSPLFMYLAIQNVHSPYELPPEWEVQNFPEMWDHTYANMLHMLDMAVGNVTGALKRLGMWSNTLIVFSADNGGVGDFGNNHPLRGHKHDPWEGGTRAAAFMSGGFVPTELQGKTSGDKLVHITDWYPTFCALAGVDPRNDVYIEGAFRHIDGVNVWPLLTGSNTTQPRKVTPTTEASIIETVDDERWWKLVTLAGQSNYYTPNATQYDGSDPCLAGRQPDPPQPGRTDPLVNGACAVCNASHPCLYDILADPYEQSNVATANADVVARLAPILDAYNDHYVTGHLDTSVLEANYTAVGSDEWGGYTGPCYRRKNSTSGMELEAATWI